MTLQRLIELLTNRVTALRNEVNIAESLGDVERVVALEDELAETESTLITLKSL